MRYARRRNVQGARRPPIHSVARQFVYNDDKWRSSQTASCISRKLRDYITSSITLPGDVKKMTNILSIERKSLLMETRCILHTPIRITRSGYLNSKEIGFRYINKIRETPLSLFLLLALRGPVETSRSRGKIFQFSAGNRPGAFRRIRSIQSAREQVEAVLE